MAAPRPGEAGGGGAVTHTALPAPRDDRCSARTDEPSSGYADAARDGRRPGDGAYDDGGLHDIRFVDDVKLHHFDPDDHDHDSDDGHDHDRRFCHHGYGPHVTALTTAPMTVNL